VQAAPALKGEPTVLNKIMLIGNLGRDPEMSYTPQGQAVTKFSLAVSRRWNDKASGERREETQWFNCVAWERLAETCNTYLRKGSKVYVEGRMTSHKYSGKDGVERTAWDCVLTQMEMLSGETKQQETRPSAEGSDGSGAGGDEWGDVTPDDIPF
jgi:single-strand DNA-binding protein